MLVTPSKNGIQQLLGIPCHFATNIFVKEYIPQFKGFMPNIYDSNGSNHPLIKKCDPIVTFLFLKRFRDRSELFTLRVIDGYAKFSHLNLFDEAFNFRLISRLKKLDAKRHSFSYLEISL